MTDLTVRLNLSRIRCLFFFFSFLWSICMGFFYLGFFVSRVGGKRMFFLSVRFLPGGQTGRWKGGGKSRQGKTRKGFFFSNACFVLFLVGLIWRDY
ncbi:hypothetical protein F5X96DRAFT_452705 [Biscogniauxia mediterranea]|nr:hypothetical protein F5X96DRAFT_452705 [Biscogniauxia mediterranea]